MGARSMIGRRSVLRTGLVIAAAFGVVVVRAGAMQPPGDFTVVPGERFGPIREYTSRAAIQGLFKVVTEVDVPIAEGFCAKGVRVLGGTPDEIDITWQDDAQTHLAFVRARGHGGRWATPKGVGVGTTLRELEKIAGSAITFSGFGWDYGGSTNWREGRGTVGLALAFDVSALPQGLDARDIYGDRLVHSDNHVIRRLPVHVAGLTLSWGPHTREFDCR